MARRRFSFGTFLLCLSAAGAVASAGRAVAARNFLESFGHVGVVKMFKGQVRDSVDEPYPDALLRVRSLRGGREYLVRADGGGNFIKTDLPPGKYRVSVAGVGSNVTEYTVRLSRGSPAASEKYMLVKLSPGCASGDSGVWLVDSVRRR